MPRKVVSLYRGVIADFYNTIYNYKLTKENNLTGGEAFLKKMTCRLDEFRLFLQKIKKDHFASYVFLYICF